PVRAPPSAHAPPAPPRPPQAARQGGYLRFERARVEADASRVVDHEVAGRAPCRVRYHRVERRDVPCAARRQVIACARVAVRRPERHAPASGARHPALTLVAPFTTWEPLQLRWTAAV